MKRKYYAYLHEHNHWVIKSWSTRARFMEILKDGFNKDSCVKGMIMPFELDLPLEEWEKEMIEKGHINLSKVPCSAVKESPALLHIKSMINRIDWTKG